MDEVSGYKTAEKPGIAAVIVCRKRLLLLKRRRIPFINNPGIWSFLFGGMKKGEKPIETAYREIQEEVRLGRGHLRMVESRRVVVFDPHKRQRWQNWFFVFVSDYDGVVKNYESADVRWASLNDILNKRDYTNIFADEKGLIASIKRHIDE